MSDKPFQFSLRTMFGFVALACAGAWFGGIVWTDGPIGWRGSLAALGLGATGGCIVGLFNRRVISSALNGLLLATGLLIVIWVLLGRMGG